MQAAESLIFEFRLAGGRRDAMVFGMPVFFECQRCTACCRWPGLVSFTNAELAAMAAHLGVTEHDFIQRFTRVNPSRTGLALMEKPDGACVFLDGDDCRVQPVKPQQCRDFPNLWNFPGFEEKCRALPRLLGDEEYRERVLNATGRSELPAGQVSSSGRASDAKSG